MAPRDDHRDFLPDPTRSYVLPARYYVDPELYRRERDAIFHRAWQYVAHVSALAEPGDYMTREIAGESIAILRDHAGVLRAFYNVCQHRAHRLLEGEGRLKATITCPYHAWAYGLDGCLRAARGSESLPGFDMDQFTLKALRVEEFLGFVFVSGAAVGPSLATIAAGLEGEFRAGLPRPEDLVLVDRRTYPIAANWKVIIDNYSECYHCPVAHSQLTTDLMDVSTYRITLHDAFHSHKSAAKRPAGPASKPGDRSYAKAFGGWFLWPNVAIEAYPGDAAQVFHVAPLGPERSLLTIEWYALDTVPDPKLVEAIEHLHRGVRAEDVVLCENVQQGLQSRGYAGGRFIINADDGNMSEHAVHHFQSLVLKALESG